VLYFASWVVLSCSEICYNNSNSSQGAYMSNTANDKEILGGTSVFAGTRVPVRNLFDYLVAGETITDFLEDFPTVSFEQVRHILQSAEVAIENHQAA